MSGIKQIAWAAASTICLWLLTLGNALAQCAMCAATVAANGKEQGPELAEGLNSGILYLMVVPYIMFSVVGFIWYRSAKKRKLATKGR